MKISPSKGIQKCPICLWTKSEAIREHLQNDSYCDEPGCPFSEEIKRAVDMERVRKQCPFTIHPKRQY